MGVPSDEARQVREASVPDQPHWRATHRRPLRNSVAPDPLDRDRVVLSERWESMEHLQEHLKRLASRPAGNGPTPQSAEAVMFEVSSASRLI